jgi:hypothetical protein
MDSVELNKELIVQIAKARETAAIDTLTEPTADNAFYNRESGRIIVQLRYGAPFSFPAALGQGLAGAPPDALAELQ